MIDVKGMTLQYPSGKGVFDVDFSVAQGEVLGYLGPNGAGKTTTIRALLGFMAPDKGSASISGRDCVGQAAEIQRTLGYIPGEIAFFDGMKGGEFLRFMHNMRGTKDVSRQKQLMDRFELSAEGKIKKFSKGMKQKLGIVAAFMHDPQVLILDEPTSGLDPLMQARFVELVLNEKQRGKTILMSSHMFEEVEKTCDNILMIRDGRIAARADVQTLKRQQRKGFTLRFAEREKAVASLAQAGYIADALADGSVSVAVPGDRIDAFMKAVSQHTVMDISPKAQTLEDVFMHYYGKEGTNQ